MPTDRSYPSDPATWYASKSSAVSSASDVVVGQHVGPASAGGVTPDPSAWDGYTPIHRVDSPSDGWNDGKDYVVYFQKDGTDPLELYKSTNGDISTLQQLTAGDEYNLADTKKQG